MLNIEPHCSKETTCVNCNGMFASIEAFLIHQKRKECYIVSRSTNKSNLVCPACNKSFKRPLQLHWHVTDRRCFPMKNNLNEATNLESSKSKAQYELRKRKSASEKEKAPSLRCVTCKKMFANERNLAVHLHKRICLKHFPQEQSSSLLDNSNSKQSSSIDVNQTEQKFEKKTTKSFQCAACEKIFSTKRAVSNHIQKRICLQHSADKIDSLRCSNCNHIFSNVGNLNLHLKRRICMKNVPDPAKEPPPKCPNKILKDATNLPVDEPLPEIRIRKPYPDYDMHIRAHNIFQQEFICDEFGAACFVCDRIWYNSSLKPIPNHAYSLLRTEFDVDENFDIENQKVCYTCLNSLRKNRIPYYSVTNGFKFPDKPTDLPQLNSISERFISPRLPFLQIRRLRHSCGQYAACGQIINVPIELDTMIKKLPRNADDDFCINVNLKKKVHHKSSVLTGFVQKNSLKKWLKFLIKTPLYTTYNIKIDEAFLSETAQSTITQEEYELLEEAPIEELHVANQQTLLWNEEKYLILAPGANSVPKSILFDEHCEELSFPTIYLGQFRKFNDNIRVTPFMIALSEIRRKDRHAVRPDHLLYVAMKILRLRVRDSLTVAFKFVSADIKITKEQIMNKAYLNNCIEKNLAFLKSVPNSAFYWQMRKRDLFAMLRQLGKPTIFLTFSANEIQWPHLLSTLHRLESHIHISREEILSHLTPLQKADLINNDPVTCAINFEHLVHVILKILCSPTVSPFKNHYVINYFYRIEFQNRGSPHCHSLLWLNEAPKNILNNAEAIINLVDKLISVSPDDSSGYVDKQTHKHTFTCTKNITRNDAQNKTGKSASSLCRFDIPFLPMKETKIIIPMNSNDSRRKEYRKHYRRYQQSLEEFKFRDIDDFFQFNGIHNYEFYETVLSAGIVRPRIFLKRHPNESHINNFNPFLLNTICANMDIQYILDEYSCATYVVEYVNKHERGMSDLQRRIIELQEKNPEFDFSDITRKLSIDLLNSTEMSSQEAAWFLLQLSMSKSSIKVQYINTVWPTDRERCRKPLKILERAEIPNDSTDIWLPNNIDLYVQRPSMYENLCLAEMISNYKYVANKKIWKQRKRPIVLRFRHYDPNKEPEDFKREQVLFYIPFRDEEKEFTDNHQYLHIFEQRADEIVGKRKLFEADLDIHKTLEICKQLCVTEEDDEDEPLEPPIREEADKDPLADFYRDPASEINADLFHAVIGKLTAVVGTKRNIMSKEEFNELVAQTNPLQRGIILHTIARLRGSTSVSANQQQPIQCFFTGPAGAGKTFVINILMEVYNRFGQTDGMCNAYITCGTTGRAACAINGTTVHTAFTITVNKRLSYAALSLHQLNQYRIVFKYVRVIIIDEISMCSAELLHQINQRLQQITGNNDKPFGGLDIFLIGDLRQLPPVLATPIYKQPKNTMTGLSLWRSLQFYELQKVMRQSDEEFSGLLTAIGNGEILTEHQQQLIQSRFVDNSSVNSICPNAIRLFYSNHKVDQFNNAVLNACPNVVSVAEDTYSGFANNAQLQKMRAEVNKLKTADMNGLPYELILVVEKMYMITKNIDVADGLANGSIGKLKLIEYYGSNEPILPIVELQSNNQDANEFPTDFFNVEMDHMDTSNQDEITRHCQKDTQKIKRLWLEFPSQRVGVKARLRAATYMARMNIQSNWVPIHQLSTTKSLGRGVVTKTVKRKQFPIVSACAVTIHKSQGGTFNELVYEYERRHEHSLVYVALSRATNLQGLYLVSPQNDFVFYYGKSTSRSTQPVQEEYQRLRSNRLITIQDQLLEIIEATSQDHLIFMVFNCQSLRANARNMNDPVTNHSKLLLLTETWLRNDEDVPILENFKLVSRFKNSQDNSKRAGGVAIFIRKDQNFLTFVPAACQSTTNSITGDSCIFNYKIDRANVHIHFICIYIRPNNSLNDVKLFLSQVLALYSPHVSRILALSTDTAKVPLILAGDFNINFTSSLGQSLTEWLRDKFGLEYCIGNGGIPTTLNSTSIDAIFYRGLQEIDTYMYMSHFSYHKPLLAIVK